MSAEDKGAVTRPWRGVSADDRRAVRRRQLLDAGRELIGTQGAAAAGVGEVCSLAGLNKRYFYESFADIDVLKEAVVVDAVEELFGWMERGVAASKASPLRSVVDATLDAFTNDPRLVRILLVETFGAGGSMKDTRERMLWFTNERAFTLSGFDPASYAKGELDVLSHAAGGALSEVIVSWFDGRIKMSRKRLADDLVDIIERMLSPRGARG